jgi:hypothetical protein
MYAPIYTNLNRYLVGSITRLVADDGENRNIDIAVTLFDAPNLQSLSSNSQFSHGIARFSRAQIFSWELAVGGGTMP